MFQLIVAALSTVLGPMFIGFILMHLIGEKLAKYVTCGVALTGVLTQIDFGTSEATMGSVGMLLGLAFLLVVLLRSKEKRPLGET